MLTPKDIEFVIPSLNRPEALERCLKSIPSACKTMPIIGTEPRPWGWIINEAMPRTTGSVICYLNDHDVLLDGCAESICRYFDLHFPNLDGAVGLCHKNEHIPNSDPEAYGCCNIAFGRPVIDHFPQGKIICPDFYHYYGDMEFSLWLKETKRFIFGLDAGIYLYHPRTKTAKTDDTHRSSLCFEVVDQNMFKYRQEQGMLWGRNFDLVNNGNPWWEEMK